MSDTPRTDAFEPTLNIDSGGCEDWCSTLLPCPTCKGNAKIAQAVSFSRQLERELAGLRDFVLALRIEVNCRIEHGAESGGHLDYVQAQLDNILKDSEPSPRECDQCGGYGKIEAQIGEVSREMACDGGDMALCGQPVFGNVRCEKCGGSGLLEAKQVPQ